MENKKKGYLTVSIIFLLPNIFYSVITFLFQEFDYEIEQVIMYSSIPLCLLMNILIAYFINKDQLSLPKVCAGIGVVLMFSLISYIYFGNYLTLVSYFVTFLSFEPIYLVMESAFPLIDAYDWWMIIVCPVVQILQIVLFNKIFGFIRVRRSR